MSLKPHCCEIEGCCLSRVLTLGEGSSCNEYSKQRTWYIEAVLFEAAWRPLSYSIINLMPKTHKSALPVFTVRHFCEWKFYTSRGFHFTVTFCSLICFGRHNSGVIFSWRTTFTACDLNLFVCIASGRKIYAAQIFFIVYVVDWGRKK